MDTLQYIALTIAAIFLIRLIIMRVKNMLPKKAKSESQSKKNAAKPRAMRDLAKEMEEVKESMSTPSAYTDPEGTEHELNPDDYCGFDSAARLVTEVEVNLQKSQNYANSYTDYDSLSKALNCLDQANPMIYRLLADDPDNSQYQYHEGYLYYMYCHVLSHLIFYADRTKISDEQYKSLVTREVEVYSQILNYNVPINSANNNFKILAKSSPWYMARIYAANGYGAKVVTDKTLQTPEILGKLTHHFGLVVDGMLDPNLLFALNTYINLLILAGKPNKACRHIELGCKVDKTNSDMVAQVEREEYKQYIAKQHSALNEVLEQRVKSLRTRFIGPNDAQTDTPHYCTESTSTDQPSAKEIEEFSERFGQGMADMINSDKQSLIDRRIVFEALKAGLVSPTIAQCFKVAQSDDYSQYIAKKFIPVVEDEADEEGKDSGYHDNTTHLLCPFM